MGRVNDQLLAFVAICLQDENGISEDAYIALRDVADTADEPLAGRLYALLRQVDATDGRFYIS